MNQNIILTIVEFVASLIVEGVVLGFIFQFISNRSQEEQRKNLQEELKSIEQQNRFNHYQTVGEVKSARDDILSQIKETAQFFQGEK